MKVNSIFFELSPSTMTSCDITKQDYENARKTWLCAGCLSPKPDIKTIDIILDDEKPENSPLNFINGTNLGIANKDFLLALGEGEVQNNLNLGKIFNCNGVLLDKWVTFIGKQRIIVRGSKNAGCRRCVECGRLLYFATGKQYLCPQPPQGVSIFDSGHGGLVVTEDIAKRIVLNKWPKLTCEELSVFDSPKDGLPDVL